MRRASGAFLLVVFLVFTLRSGEAQTDLGWHKISGEFNFYSGTLGDKTLPTSKDPKVAFHVSGTAAARMFQYMGRTARIDVCADTDQETRARGELSCTRYQKTGETRCWFGFDLHSGKSIGGVVC